MLFSTSSRWGFEIPSILNFSHYFERKKKKWKKEKNQNLEKIKNNDSIIKPHLDDLWKCLSTTQMKNKVEIPKNEGLDTFWK